MSREALKAIQYRPFIEGRDNALDHDQHNRLASAGIKCDTKRLIDLHAYGVDLKDAMNATPWKRIVPLTQPTDNLAILSPFIHSFL